MRNTENLVKMGEYAEALGNAGLSRRRFTSLAFLAACSCALPSFLTGCSSSSSASTVDKSTFEELSTTLFLFDTVIQVSALCNQELLDAVTERMEYFEQKFSRTVEGSDIWNINEAQGAPVEVAQETADVIKAAIGFSEESDGLFDITIGAVSTLWDFNEGVKPTDDEIAAALPHVGYQTISVDGTTVTLADPEAKLDLGGIAKGYICDDIVAMLREGGCEQACISLGGNVYVMGNSFDGDAWNVGVQDPNGSVNTTIASIECGDISVVTSGLYERYFELDGVTYYHILDPKTGYPVETDLESASITCTSSTAADAYSTILFLKGHDAAMELIQSDDRFEGLLVDNTGTATKSEGSAFVIL